ncbi:MULTISPECIES: exodeoxyribonuclease V subunit gamma [unclassified Luteococcus]|uniref:exodeoxyribonuclease V subunit gamma n=1 Tax=unclassified Luteococcus TaxID=2639923 RepID=UPI00313A772A
MNQHANPLTTGASAGLELVLCPDWESLCTGLADQLGQPLPDPFASQLVVVDSPATRRGLSQALASGPAGISAGVTFLGLRGLRRRLEEVLLGVQAANDPWRSRGLTLALLDVMAQVADEPWFAPLQHHLGGAQDEAADRPGRRLATADRIARLFLRYCRTAPTLVRAWSEGLDVDPLGAPLTPRASWQPHLWRRVGELLGPADPVRRHAQLSAAIAHQDGPLLPDPVLRLVNPTPCPPLDRELVTALATRMPVSLWQQASERESALDGRWGATGRVGLGRWREAADTVRRQPGQARPGLPADVQVHASHGPDRQVEVLREVLCALLADDPTLEPRDIVVACPDLDLYAPLVRASFCLDPAVVGEHLHPGHQLRVQLADASLDQPNQVLETLRLVLRLAGQRATAQDLVDLCGSAPVARRFGLGSDELERISRLVQQADIRWGLDRTHRSDFGLGQVAQSTWLAGVDRVLTGIAVGPTPLRWLGTALPVEQVDSTDVLAAGSLAEIVSRTRKLVADWRQPAGIGEWIGRLHGALDLLTAAEGDDAWQLTQARGELADLADLTADRVAPLRLGDVQALFDRLLRTGRGRPNFGNGSLLVCGLDDLGGVAHRVVAVLGLDDQRFPARPPLDGDDLVAGPTADPETDPRARDRELLLQAVESARDHLVVVHQGFTPRTNEPVPRPVSVIDLREAAAAADVLREFRHSLQPQAGTNFQQGQAERPFSFDRAALAGAQARELQVGQPEAGPEPLWQTSFGPLPGPDESLDLATLTDFYRHPARELLRRRLGVSMTEWGEELDDELPIEPNGLQEWAIGDRMVRLALDGLDPGQIMAAERLRGQIPPGHLGSRTLNKIGPVVGKVVNAAARERSAAATDVDCELDLPGAGQLLTGRVRVHDASIVSLAFSRTSATHLLQAWLELLLLAGSQPAPELGWRAVHIGRDAVATLSAPPPQRCRELLTELAALRQAGLVRLVPLPVKAAATFQRATPLRPFRDHDPDTQAAREFRYEHDADWARFLPQDFDALRRIPPEPGDPGVPGPSRFENLSDWLFAPLREHLSVGNLR